MIAPRNPVVIHSKPGGVVIDVRVITRAGKSGLAGTRGASLLVRLQAPPVDGAANAELVALLSAALDVPRRAISIVTGERSRQKLVHVEGVDVVTASSRLLNT
jgi:uncharacterized protein (TIGR00251 family)